jgi:hypothetical protein
MKRSNMLLVIREALCEIMEIDSNDVDDVGFSDEENILSRIETAGMLPPTYQRRVDNPIHGPDWYEPTNKWEKE